MHTRASIISTRFISPKLLSPSLVRRASSCSSVILVAVRSLASSSSSVFHIHNRQRFSTSSANNPGGTSGRSASAAELRNSKLIADGISDQSSSLLDGLPFDSIERPKDGSITLRRKTEDEIIAIRVKEEMDFDSGMLVHAMDIKIHYGFSFKKQMKFNVIVFPGDQGKIVIRNVTMSVDASEGDSQVHVDELEGFFEKRGINRANLDFLVKYAERRKEYDKLVELNGKPAKS